ncbi:glycosyltransferase family 2 protein [Pseudomonas sp. LRP2-20]|uniref:glycosyltransferase family 2 protein n=1 Tax=Pseudomonas sp. LRP2-20 TaxID=2944234 RepID=UPI002184A7BE|nr:glycosyltransferase family 2 protein [Pseudomonas sp. LRP2-20]
MNPPFANTGHEGRGGVNAGLAAAAQSGDALNHESVEVAILMCTYNGAAFLQDQLESFACQSHTRWTLYVSDDASTDATRQMLADYQQRWGDNRIKVFDGPCQGFAKNFISLLKRPEVQGRFYAFSDQDDVWFKDKLERSVACLVQHSASRPALYCSRTRLVDVSRNAAGFSPLFSRPPSFRNALVQSLAGANTMLINQAARDVLIQLPEDAHIVAHDWLAYMLVTACGGDAVYDAQPSLEYRQHGNNLIGGNNRLVDRLRRLRKMLSGRFVEWNDANLRILQAMQPLLTQENRNVLEHFAVGRRSGFARRLCEFRRSGVYRQTFVGNITLIIAALLARI